MKQIIINYIRAGYPGLYLVSPEEQRVEAELKVIAKELDFKLYSWSTTTGVTDTETGSIREANDPMEALLAIEEMPEQAIFVLRDFHLFLDEPNPILLRQIRDVLKEAKTKSKTLIVLGCRLCLPPELERELAVIEYALPSKADLTPVLDGILSTGTQSEGRMVDWIQGE